MCQWQFPFINYIEDFLGYGTPTYAQYSYDALYDVMYQLGLTISENKLVTSCTLAVCLGILFDTVDATLSIPEEKLTQAKIRFMNGLVKYAVHNDNSSSM